RLRFSGNRYREPGSNTWIVTQEGLAAIDEAIGILQATRPMAPLALDAGLNRAAADLVRWQGPRGALGHAGDGGSSPGDRIQRQGIYGQAWAENVSYGSVGAQVVIDLIVDDGVPDRGHRTNILNPLYRLVGIAAGPHRGYGTMCAMDFTSAR